jgi:hypothetical protein
MERGDDLSLRRSWKAKPWQFLTTYANHPCLERLDCGLVRGRETMPLLIGLLPLRGVAARFSSSFL